MARTVFFNVNGAGFKGAAVPAKEAGAVGFYVDGVPYTPDRDAIRALLPYRWRAAFDRAQSFWTDKYINEAPAHVAIHDRRGRHLTTIYAHGQVSGPDLADTIEAARADHVAQATAALRGA